MEKVKPPQWDQIHKLSLSQQGDHMTLQFLLWNTRLYYRKFLLFFLHFGIEWQGKFWPFFVIWDLPDFGPLMIEFFFTTSSSPQCLKIALKCLIFKSGDIELRSTEKVNRLKMRHFKTIFTHCVGRYGDRLLQLILMMRSWSPVMQLLVTKSWYLLNDKRSNIPSFWNSLIGLLSIFYSVPKGNKRVRTYFRNPGIGAWHL